MAEPPSQPPPEKKPWPMHWVALVIVVYIVGYTVINVFFRKTEPPHEPYAEAQERRQMRTIRASMMGWTRLAVDAAPNTDLPATKRTVAARDDYPLPIEQLVPPEVMLIAPGKPALYPTAESVWASAALQSTETLELLLQFTAIDDLPSVGEPLAYAKDGELHVFLQAESDVRTRWVARPATQRLGLALHGHEFPPGHWTGTLYTADAVFRWEFDVTAAPATGIDNPAAVSVDEDPH